MPFRSLPTCREASIPAALAQATPPAAAPAAPAPKKGPTYLNFPGKNDRLVVIGDRPLVAETPEHLLNDDTTPTDKFFIRNNGQIPDEAKEPDKWKITVDGEVNNKLEITLGELKSKYKAQTRRMVLECGGNGRSFYSPPASGNQWTNGGAGCAEWTGIKLGDLLKTAGVKPSGIYTAHYSSDLHLSGDANRPTISRGVRLAKAMDPETMIVWAMNGQPLSNIHGGPVRLVIPGWPGSASQKWLTKITIRDKEHDGPGMTGTSYRLAIKPMVPGDKADPANFKIMESMPVRSIITSPANGDKLAAGTQRAETARRVLGRRSHRQARRCVDRLRHDLAGRQAREGEEPLRLAALDRDAQSAERRLLRDLVARHRLQQCHAAACRRELESERLRRQSDAPDCGVDRLMLRLFSIEPAARVARRVLFGLILVSCRCCLGAAAGLHAAR